MKLVLSVLTLFLAVEAWAGPGGAAAESDPVAFVRLLYEQNLARNGTGAPPPSDEEFLAPFTTDLCELWIVARDHPLPADTPDGPVFHTYFGSGALPGRPVVLKAFKEEARAETSAIVGVDLAVLDHDRHVQVSLAIENGTWRIANIAYGDNSDFVSWLKRRAGQ